MSTGNISLDIMLDNINKANISGLESQKNKVINDIVVRFNVSYSSATEIYKMILAAFNNKNKEPELIVTAPASFSVEEKTTKNLVVKMINEASNQIIITGYSLSDYFESMVDCLIDKSKTGVLVKFFANDLEGQAMFEKLLMHKGRFLQIYNYCKKDDKMASLHAKVLCVDNYQTLITSANLSYHGQQGNIEVGTYNESFGLAKSIDDFFTKLVFMNTFKKI